jgi:thiol:disulfide interchange protein DsbC
VKRILSERDDIAFYIKLYPLKMHKDAYRKSKAIQCEKSLQLLEDAFAKKEIPDPKCDTDEIDKNIALAQKLGITGTPTIILEDGRILRGLVKAEKLLRYIDSIKVEKEKKGSEK